MARKIELSHKGLVLKDVTVRRGGKTFTQKRWVKAGEDEPAKPKSKKEIPKDKVSFNIGDSLNFMGTELKIEKISEIEQTIKLSNGKVYTFEAIVFAKKQASEKPEPKKEIKVKDLKSVSKKVEPEPKKEVTKKPKVTITKPKKINTKDLSKQMNNYTDNLSDKLIIDNTQKYTSSDYEDLNPYLRENKFGENEVFDKKIENISSFLDGAPKMKGTVYRGMSFWTNDKNGENDFNNFMREIKKNKNFTFKSFTSTSTDKKAIENTFTSGDRSIVFEIKSKAGVYLNGVSNFPSEHEVLFNKDSKFKILKVNDKDSSKIKITMEEI